MQYQPQMDDLKLSEEAGQAPDSEERVSEMWAEFEGQQAKMRTLMHEHSMSHWDLDDEYDQTTFLYGGYEKDYSGIANDWRMKQTCAELEWWIEEVIGEKRIREGKFKMYKGQVKKW